MIKVVFLGFGNVNSHLFNTLNKSTEVSILQVFNRNQIRINSPFENIPFTDDILRIVDADVYIIGIPDDAISSFSESLAFQNKPFQKTWLKFLRKKEPSSIWQRCL